MGFITAVSTVVDIIAPIYTILAIITVVVYAKASKFSRKSDERRVYEFVKKAKISEDDPDAWKKKFAGNWTLQRREGLKEFLSHEGFGSFKISIVQNMGHTLKITFKDDDVNSAVALECTGVPNGTMPWTLMDGTPTPRIVENRPHTFEMYWDEPNKAYIVDFVDMEYPATKGGRKMHIIRTLEDDNMLVTKYEQTNLKDNAKTGYIQYTTRVIG